MHRSISVPAVRARPACDSGITSTEPISKPRGDIQAFLEGGFRALKTGDREAAADICRQALERDPLMARAHYLAALLALDRGNHRVAEKALRRTVELNERHAPAWARLALSYVAVGEFAKSESCLQNAVRTQQGNPEVLDSIGTTFRLAGNLQQARAWHERAVAGAPSHVPFLINLANIHLYFGEQDAADELLSRCLEIEPHNAQLHWLLSRTSKARNVWHIEAMQDLVVTQQEPRARAYLHYAIGKEAEDLEDWELAFDAFAAGAWARRQTVAYNEAQDVELYQAVRQTFTKEWLASQEAGLADAAPIFIVGEPRTGTTLLERMLGAHSRVNSAGELKHLSFAVRRITGQQEPKQFTAALLQAAAKAKPFDIGTAYFESTASLRGEAAHLIDKLPLNYLYLPLIVGALPKARILHLTRDPMDACFAAFKQLFGDAYLFSYDQQELARHHVRYRDLMATWRERFGEHFLDVAYEDLVTDTENTLRRVLEYVGLSWQPQCLDFTASQDAVTTASAAQVREKPHTRSIGRWRRYVQQLQPMQDVLSNHGIRVS